jgi:hypothetical protein
MRVMPNSQVAEARSAHEAAVEAVEGAQVSLMQAIRERYTEEQVGQGPSDPGVTRAIRSPPLCLQLWADKIRRASTWWTWGLVSAQVLSFAGVVFFIEPRRVNRQALERVPPCLVPRCHLLFCERACEALSASVCHRLCLQG